MLKGFVYFPKSQANDQLQGEKTNKQTTLNFPFMPTVTWDFSSLVKKYSGYISHTYVD